MINYFGPAVEPETHDPFMNFWFKSAAVSSEAKGNGNGYNTFGKPRNTVIAHS